jgi:hypothetical protein
MTRAGTLFAYDTPGAACPLGSWPRFHHDNANSGVLERDAVAPGKAIEVGHTALSLAIKAPGGDLMCGRAAGYQLVVSDTPIGTAQLDSAPATASSFDAGSTQTLTTGRGRYVAVRFRDDQGNVGRPLEVDRGRSGRG